MSHFEGANPVTMKNENIIWRRIKNDSNTFIKNYFAAEVELMTNMDKVFFGSVLAVQILFKNYPCHIESTSKVLLKVITLHSSWRHQKVLGTFTSNCPLKMLVHLLKLKTLCCDEKEWKESTQLTYVSLGVIFHEINIINAKCQMLALKCQTQVLCMYLVLSCCENEHLQSNIFLINKTSLACFIFVHF